MSASSSVRSALQIASAEAEQAKKKVAAVGAHSVHATVCCRPGQCGKVKKEV